jgi:hypothetical protein
VSRHSFLADAIATAKKLNARLSALGACYFFAFRRIGQTSCRASSRSIAKPKCL